MQSRRSLRLVAGALVLATPLLGSCGFGKATERNYTPSVGINDREGDVKVLNAVVVSAQPESGTFIASLSNNGDEETSFDGLEGAGDWSAGLTVGDVEPVELPAGQGFANLADDGGVAISGDFEPGDVLTLRLSFGGGDPVTMNVPVVFACDEFTGLDTSAESSASEEPTPSDEPSPGDVPTDDATTKGEPSETETSAAPDSGAEDTYDCAVALGEE